MAQQVVVGGHILMHPQRYDIISALRGSTEGLSVSQIAEELGVDRQLVSFHMMTLSDYGFVEGEYRVTEPPMSRGRAVKIYRVTEKTEETFDELSELLEKF